MVHQRRIVLEHPNHETALHPSVHHNDSSASHRYALVRLQKQLKWSWARQTKELQPSVLDKKSKRIGKRPISGARFGHKSEHNAIRISRSSLRQRWSSSCITCGARKASKSKIIQTSITTWPTLRQRRIKRKIRRVPKRLSVTVSFKSRQSRHSTVKTRRATQTECQYRSISKFQTRFQLPRARSRDGITQTSWAKLKFTTHMTVTGLKLSMRSYKTTLSQAWSFIVISKGKGRKMAIQQSQLLIARMWSKT